jgi:Uma2 family endonuclease
MPAKTLISVEEYLKTSFEDGDRDYVDGEVIERDVGETPHARVQRNLLYRLMQIAEKLRIEVLPEIRVQVAKTRFRVADLAVWRAGPLDPVPQQPPLLVVEVLSSEDRMSRILPRIHDFLAMGVRSIWLIDPRDRTAFIFSQQHPGGTPTEVLRADEPGIEIPLADVLPVE